MQEVIDVNSVKNELSTINRFRSHAGAARSATYTDYLKNFMGVFVLFDIIFSADNALGIEHSFAF
jgi:hypothetical protein